MAQHALSDEQWERVRGLLPGKVGDRGRHAADNRVFLEAVFWIVETGAPWHALPERFGKWNSVFQRFHRWAASGVFERLFDTLSGDRDFEFALVDGMIVWLREPDTELREGLLVRRSRAMPAPESRR